MKDVYQSEDAVPGTGAVLAGTCVRIASDWATKYLHMLLPAKRSSFTIIHENSFNGPTCSVLLSFTRLNWAECRTSIQESLTIFGYSNSDRLQMA